jgi:hypothetical protein
MTRDFFTSNLTFFNQKLSVLSNTRLQVLRSKNIVNYLITSNHLKETLSVANEPMGYFSFTIYYLRFLTELIALADYLCQESNQSKDEKAEALYNFAFSLFNDGIWGTTNLIEFCCLSFSVSKKAGLLGLQLEVSIQLLDLVLMSLQFMRARKKGMAALLRLSGLAKEEAELEQRYKAYQFMRGVTHLVAISTTLSLFAFSLVNTLPIAAIIYGVSLISGAIKLYLIKQQHRAEGALLQKAKVPQDIQDSRKAAHRIKEKQAGFEFVTNYGLLPLVIILALNPQSIAVSALLILLIAAGNKHFDHQKSAKEKKERLIANASKKSSIVTPNLNDREICQEALFSKPLRVVETDHQGMEMVCRI